MKRARVYVAVGAAYLTCAFLYIAILDALPSDTDTTVAFVLGTSALAALAIMAARHFAGTGGGSGFPPRRSAASDPRRAQIATDVAPHVAEGDGDNLAAFASGIPGATGWLCGDMYFAGQTEVARDLATLGDEDGDLPARYYLGMLCEDAGDFKAAADAYRRAVPLPQAAWRWGNALRELGDARAVSKVFRKHARADPECAVECVTTGDMAAFEARFVLLRHLHAGVLDVLIPLAEVFDELGDRERALECLRLSVLSGEPNAPWNYGRTLEGYAEDGLPWILLGAVEGDERAVARVVERLGDQWKARIEGDVVAHRRDLASAVGHVSLW